MRTIAVMNGKGGAGKSTLATALAAEYQRQGAQCLLVDADAPQFTALRWAKSGDSGVTAVAVADLSDIGRLATGYDVTIIDTPGRDDRQDMGGAGIVRTCMMIADLALVPCQPTPADVWATADILATLRRAQGLRPGLRASVVLNRLDPRTAYSRAVRETLEQSASVCTASLHQRVDFAASMAAGQGPTTYAPGSKAAAEVRALFEEIQNAAEEANAPVPVVA